MSSLPKSTGEVLRKPPLYMAVLWIIAGLAFGYFAGVVHTRYLARINGAAHYEINGCCDAEFRWGPKP